MNLPNALTLGRIFLVPLLVVVLLTKFEGRLILGVRKELVGAAIFGVASLTDWLDGYLARRRKQVTTLGQMMDPLADKLLTSAAFISLVQMDLAPAWMVAVIIGREFAVTGAAQHRLRARRRRSRRRRSARSRWSSQVVAILLLILGQDHLQPFLRARPDRAVGGGSSPRWSSGGRLLPAVQRAHGCGRAFDQVASRWKACGASLGLRWARVVRR